MVNMQDQTRRIQVFSIFWPLQCKSSSCAVRLCCTVRVSVQGCYNVSSITDGALPQSSGTSSRYFDHEISQQEILDGSAWI